VLQNIPAYYHSRPLILAGKITLLLAIAGFSLLALLWSMVLMVIGSLGARHLWMHFGAQGFELIAIITLATLAALRVADVLQTNRAKTTD
jgi:hypothetical protein